MKKLVISSMKDIKKMFARAEHVRVEYSLFGIKYLDPKTGKSLNKEQALRFLSGDY